MRMHKPGRFSDTNGRVGQKKRKVLYLVGWSNCLERSNIRMMVNKTFSYSEVTAIASWYSGGQQKLQWFLWISLTRVSPNPESSDKLDSELGNRTNQTCISKFLTFLDVSICSPFPSLAVANLSIFKTHRQTHTVNYA